MTTKDREFLASAYEYANANGEAPEQVDNLAFDLAFYRMTGPSGPLDSTGNLYDTDGNPIINEFNTDDEAAA